jgi:hypothetical protein
MPCCTSLAKHCTNHIVHKTLQLSHTYARLKFKIEHILSSNTYFHDMYHESMYWMMQEGAIKQIAAIREGLPA